MPRARLPPPQFAWALAHKKHTEEREVKYGRQWTEGQELLAQLYAVQATHEAVDQQIGSAGCHMHPGMLEQMLQTEVQLNSLKQKLSFHRCLLTTIRLEFLTTRVNPAYTEADQTFASLGLPREYLRQREMDNLELTLINQEIVERINFWRLHVLNLEDFADDAGIPISQDLRAVCRLCDGDLEPIQGADAILEVLHDAYKAQTSIKYFAAARVPWDGLGGVPFGPVQVSHGDMDGWTLGSIISYDAQAVPTPLPDSEPEVEVKSPQCVEELISEEASQLLEAYERLNKAAKAQKAKIAPLTAASTLHVPQSSSSGACKGRGLNMFSGDGSRDYCGILAAKSQRSQSQPQPQHDLIAAFEIPPPSSSVQPDDPSAQQLQQSSGDQPAVQLGGQLAPFIGQHVQPRGQREEGRPSRHTEEVHRAEEEEGTSVPGV
ncbi:TPA: hypothetical protein ACH3X3_011946 [Trebouxia sp. C0006]